MKTGTVILCLILMACGRKDGPDSNPNPKTAPDRPEENCVLAKLSTSGGTKQELAVGVHIKRSCAVSDETLKTILNERN